ncbi:MAG TPA: septum formation family protein [Candidatus Limnocylindrales bacterium]|nr:septum formation family protein [Candidatus Limnocylindrales bacterium]
MRGIGLRIAIIGAVIVGAIILRPFLSGNASQLAVGDCFDEPTNAAATVEDVQHRPCTDPHDGEVVFVANYEPSSATYPTDDEFTAFYGPKCLTAFSTITGTEFMTQETYDMIPMMPTSGSWADGNRKVICYAVNVDKSKLSAPLKKS